MQNKQVKICVNLFIYIAIISKNTILSKQRHRVPVMPLAQTWLQTVCVLEHVTD